MTSAEAAALRDLFICEDSKVPEIDPRQLAKAYVAIVRPPVAASSSEQAAAVQRWAERSAEEAREITSTAIPAELA